MVRTNDKRVREAMQRHVLSFYKGEGGRTALVDQIEALMRRGKRGMYQEFPTARAAGAYMTEGGCFLCYNSDVEKFLHRLGFTDQARIDKFRNSYGEGAWALYVPMCAKACEEIYDDYMKKHPSALRTARGY